MESEIAVLSSQLSSTRSRRGSDSHGRRWRLNTRDAHSAFHFSSRVILREIRACERLYPRQSRLAILGCQGNSMTGDGRLLRFGVFEVDLQSAELRKHGLRIKLREQPFQILSLLLVRPGQVVSRDELQKMLWPA